MVGVFGIFFALASLIFLAYRGINVLLLAPVMALVACLFQPGTPLLASYTQVFMPALGHYLLQYFPIFILGALFGRVMNDTGCAESLAAFITRVLGTRHAILAVVLTCALLTYGGVSLFVVAFTVYPIALNLFRKAHVATRLIPATIALGSFTFTMTALPGTPAIQNAIPMPVFGTTAFAAPALGVVASVIMFLFGMGWLTRRARTISPDGDEAPVRIAPDVESSDRPPVLLALLPLVLVVVLNYVFSHQIFPALETSYLSEPRYGSTTLEKVVGIWSLVAALSASLAMCLALFWRRLVNPPRTLNEGTFGSMLPIFNTASEVGFGAVVASLPAFQLVRANLLSLAPGNPLVSLAVGVNSLAAMTGSASGGLSIALESLGKTFAERGIAAGFSPETLHRIAAISCSGLDALPHNGAVITLLTICGMTHRKSYADIFMVAAVGTSIANIVVVLVASTVPGLR